MRTRHKLEGGWTLTAAALLAVLAVIVATLAPQLDRSSQPHPRNAAAPAAVPSTTKPLVAFTSDYGLIDDRLSEGGIGGFDATNPPSTYEGEANGLVYVSTNGTTGPAQVYIKRGSSSSDTPVALTCDLRIKSHPIITSYLVPSGGPGPDTRVVVVAFAVRDSYSSPTSAIEVVQFDFGFENGSSGAPTPPAAPLPNCSTGANLTKVVFGGQTGDNEWPTFDSTVPAVPQIVYSSTRDNPLGDLYLQALGTDTASRLTNGTAAGVANTQPVWTALASTQTQSALLFTTTAFRRDGSLGTIAYTEATPAVQTVNNPWLGSNAGPPQSSQAFPESPFNSAPRVFYRTTTADPLGDVYAARSTGLVSSFGYQLDATTARPAAATDGVAESDPGSDSGARSFDRNAGIATVDAVVSDDPTQRGIVVENDDAARPPARYDTSAPAYSADGTKLAYSQSLVTAAQLASGAVPARSIYVSNADGSKPVRLTLADPSDTGRFFDTNPTWSPDGTTIAFQRITYAVGGVNRVQSSMIYAVPADGSAGATALDPQAANNYIDGSPSYSPDGSYLAISRTPVADVIANAYFDDTAVTNGGTTTLHGQLFSSGPASAANSVVQFSIAKNLTPTAATTPYCVIDNSATTANFVTCTLPRTPTYNELWTFNVTVTAAGSRGGATTGNVTVTDKTTSTELNVANNTATASITIGQNTNPAIARPRAIRPRLGVANPGLIAVNPNGGPLALEGVRGAPGLNTTENSELWILDPATGNAGALEPPVCAGNTRASCVVSGRQPAWSPDGAHLAYESGGEIFDATLENSNVADAAPEGISAVTAVTGFKSWAGGTGVATANRSVLASAADPAWNPDGASLYITGQPAGSPDRSGIYRVNTDGTGVSLVAQGPGPESEPAAQASADLSVTIAAAPSTIYTNDQTTVTATVTNNGPATARGMTLVFTLPTGLTPGAVPAGCTVTGQTVTCTITGPLAGGATATVSITVVGTTAGTYDGLSGDQPQISATVSGPALDIAPANNTATASVIVLRRANLDLTIAAAPATLKTGNATTITATVTNNGPGTAGATTMTIFVPAGVDPPTALTPSGGTAPTCSFAANSSPPPKPGGVITCDIGALATKGSQVVTFNATSEDAAVYTFRANVETATEQSDDTNLSSQVDVRWTTHAGLSVIIDAVPQTIVIGEQTTVTATVTNIGPDTAGGPSPTPTLGSDTTPPPPFATLTIQLPAGMSVPVPPTGCTIVGTTMTCQLAPLGAGESRSFTFTATGQVLGDHRYDATVTSNTADDDPSDNTDSTTVTVVRQIADLSVTITPSQTSVAPGNPFDAVITVRNGGAYPAENSTLNTSFDARLQPSAAPACAAGSSTCTLGTLAPGDEVSFIVTLNAKHDGSPPHPYTATMSAQVATSTTETDTANNTASASVQVIERDFVADVAVRIALAPVAYVGGTTQARVRVVNLGPQPAAQVRLRVTIPATLNAVSVPLCVTDATVCQLGSLAAGESRTFVLQFTPQRLRPARNYGAVVVARVSTSTAESSTANNVDRERLPVKQPTVTLLPPIGPPGFVTLAFGENLPPGRFITIRWQSGITTYDGPYKVDPDGTFTAPMQVVRRDVLGTRRLVLSPAAPGLFGPVGATMLVVPSQGSPPRFFGRG